MKKKIDYKDIPENVLNKVIGECYGLGDYTLRSELDKFGQDIIYSRHNLADNGYGEHFEFFHAWTKDYALMLIDSMFGDKIILALNRNPPEEIKIERTEKRNRKRR